MRLRHIGNPLNLPAHICRRNPIVLNVRVDLSGVADRQTIDLLTANRGAVGGRANLAEDNAAAPGHHIAFHNGTGIDQQRS